MLVEPKARLSKEPEASETVIAREAKPTEQY